MISGREKKQKHEIVIFIDFHFFMISSESKMLKISKFSNVPKAKNESKIASLRNVGIVKVQAIQIRSETRPAEDVIPPVLKKKVKKRSKNQ